METLLKSNKSILSYLILILSSSYLICVHTVTGECISGALYWKDLHRLAEEIGFTSPRLVIGNIVEIEKPDLKEAVRKSLSLSLSLT